MTKKILPIIILYIFTALFGIFYNLYDKNISIEYDGSIIYTNLMVILFVAITFIIILWALYKLFSFILTSPLSIFHTFNRYKQEKALESLGNTLAFAAIHEYQDAKRLMEEAKNHDFPIAKEVEYLVNSLINPKYMAQSDSYVINFYNIAVDAYKHQNLINLEECYDFFKTKFPKFNITKKLHNMLIETKAKELYSQNKLDEASSFLNGFSVSKETEGLGILHAEIELERDNKVKATNILAELWENAPSYKAFELILDSMSMDSIQSKSTKLLEFFTDINHNQNAGLLLSTAYLLDENIKEGAEKLFEQTKDDGSELYKYVKAYLMLSKQNVLGAAKILSTLIIDSKL